MCGHVLDSRSSCTSGESFITFSLLLATLCAYTQQGYAFGHVHLYICMSTKNRLFSTLPLKNLLLSVISCFLFEFKHLQCGLLRRFSQIIQGGPPGPEIFSSEF